MAMKKNLKIRGDTYSNASDELRAVCSVCICVDTVFFLYRVAVLQILYMLFCMTSVACSSE